MSSFWTKVDGLEAWHAKLVDKPWLQPLKPTKFVIVLIILSTLIAASMNWYVGIGSIRCGSKTRRFFILMTARLYLQLLMHRIF